MALHGLARRRANRRRRRDRGAASEPAGGDERGCGPAGRRTASAAGVLQASTNRRAGPPARPQRRIVVQGRKSVVGEGLSRDGDGRRRTTSRVRPFGTARGTGRSVSTRAHLTLLRSYWTSRAPVGAGEAMLSIIRGGVGGGRRKSREWRRVGEKGRGGRRGKGCEGSLSISGSGERARRLCGGGVRGGRRGCGRRGGRGRGRGCRSWWCGARCGRAAPGRCGRRCRLRAGGSRTNAGRCGS